MGYLAVVNTGLATTFGLATGAGVNFVIAGFWAGVAFFNLRT